MKHATIILKRKRDREISLEMLSEQELEQIAALTAYDEYALDEYVFSVLGNEIKITDEVIAAALNALPEDKRNIILLFYFLEQSATVDEETYRALHNENRLIADVVCFTASSALLNLDMLYPPYAPAE